MFKEKFDEVAVKVSSFLLWPKTIQVWSTNKDGKEAILTSKRFLCFHFDTARLVDAQGNIRRDHMAMNIGDKGEITRMAKICDEFLFDR